MHINTFVLHIIHMWIYAVFIIMAYLIQLTIFMSITFYFYLFLFFLLHYISTAVSPLPTQSNLSPPIHPAAPPLMKNRGLPGISTKGSKTSYNKTRYIFSHQSWLR